MSAAVSRRSAALRKASLAGGLLALGSVLLVSPAYADSTPTPIASEPPGGATCAPGLPTANCGQDTGSTSTPSPAATTTRSTAGGTTRPSTGSSSLPRTGPTSLAHTGAGAAGPWGLAGIGVLAGGALVVVVARRPRSEPA